MAKMTFSVQGPFEVADCQGNPLHFHGSKEKALLVLLVFSPRHKRTRSWLIDKLWTSRFPKQGQTSLRQALKNIRRVLGPQHDDYLHTDRFSVSLVGPVSIDYSGETGLDSELLEDIDVPEPEFEDWIRDLRVSKQAASHLKPVALQTPPLRSDNAITCIGLVLDLTDAGRDEIMIANCALDTLSEVLSATGGIEIKILKDRLSGSASRACDALITLHCKAVQGEWFVVARATRSNGRHLSWSDRLRLPMSFSAIWDGPQIPAFAGKIRTAVVDCLSRPPAVLTPYLTLQRATQMLYSGNAQKILDADQMLAEIISSTGSPNALAWRSFARMTKLLEFKEIEEPDKQLAESFLVEALGSEVPQSQVYALASLVNFKLLGDIDYGHFLAKRATELDERNAYALDALSQSSFYLGEFERGFRTSVWAREAAASLPNAFNWDMRSSLSALSLGKIDMAIELAQASHYKLGTYRPALRYLYALNLLQERPQVAGKYLKLLQSAEPGFSAEDILDPDYPMDTFRLLGLHEEL